jgi:hypothetical protein
MSRILALLGLLAWFGSAKADEPVRLQERFIAGDQYSVKSRSDVSGTLTLPAEKGKAAAQPLTIRGDSAIEYDERVLGLTAKGDVQKTVRICRRVDFRRTVGDKPQESRLRPAVRRLVLLRDGIDKKAPFSPDGPLTWAEIDLIRTDIFVPALVGLLPDTAVKAGDSWTASTEAVQELTGLKSLDDGKLECRLEQVVRRQARIALSGTVRGMTDDGTSRQQLKGHYLFDLDAGRLTYVELRGVHSLLGTDGQEVGRIEGRFVLSRQVDARVPELGDDSLRGVTVEPDAENTLLLYDNTDLGVRFVYPRRWRVVGASGNQVAVDAPDGSGFLLTVEAPGKTPTGAQFLNESRDFLVQQKARIVRIDPPQTVQTNPPRERFGLDVELNGQKFSMDYHLTRQPNGGAILAARLLSGDQKALRSEVERVARSVAFTKRVGG